MINDDLAYVAIQAALRAGEVLRRGYNTAFQVSFKPGMHNLVTEYDKAAENSIITFVREHFPDHAFLAEESGGIEKTDKVLWIIDPLDGTLNFVHHIPFFSVSIGAYVNQQIQVGVIYVPMLNELFVAKKGGGAFLNGKRIHVSKTTAIEQAVAAVGFPHRKDENAFKQLDRFVTFAKLGNPIRDLGSAAMHLAYLAAGRIDLFWNPSLQPWDMAAGKLLVDEAGGKVTHYDGSPHQIFSDCNLIASNSFLHETILKYL